jgi:glycosyltransferase involved in cell wall biosynthesis
MEAMAMGTTVVASRVAGIPELVSDGRTGLLFTPSKWSELADCLRRLISDQPLRQRLSEDAKTAVAAEFDIHRSANQLRGLFESAQ